MKAAGRAQKGSRVARELRQLHTAIGIAATRAMEPISTCMPAALMQRRWSARVKARGNGKGFATLERWLGDGDICFCGRTAPNR